MNSFAPELEAARMARPPVKDDDASAGPPPGPTPTTSPAPAPRPEWLEETVVAGRAAARWLGQPRPRTALVGVALYTVKDRGWVDLPVLAVTVLVTHLGMLFWETRYVSASLAFPSLKPQRKGA